MSVNGTDSAWKVKPNINSIKCTLSLTVLARDLVATRRLCFFAMSHQTAVLFSRPLFISTLHWDWLVVLTHKQLSDWLAKLFMTQRLFGHSKVFLWILLGFIFSYSARESLKWMARVELSTKLICKVVLFTNHFLFFLFFLFGQIIKLCKTRH